MATVHGKLESILGAAVEAGSVEIALCGYASFIPQGGGTYQIAKPAQELEADAGTGLWTATVPGNDQILPAGTYYTVTVKDANGDIVQVNAYIFLGTGNYDLSTTPPFNPTQPPPPIPPLIFNQLLLIPFNPTPNFPGDQYTTWGITLTGDVVSGTLSGIVAGNLYTFIITQDGAGGHTFTWPATVLNATAPDPAPNSVTVQTFVAVASGTGPLLPIGPATYNP